MLSLLKIKNIALIEEVELEFANGLNLLTGETGSGKSIIVDSLSALTGERITSEIIKNGEQTARIEGLFVIRPDVALRSAFEESGIEIEDSDEIDLIVRRELSAAGKNRIFINNQLVTQSFLRQIGTYLVDIHGQGEQASLFNRATHLEILDEFAGVEPQLTKTAEKYRIWSQARRELDELRKNEAEKLQILDVLRFQVDEIAKAALKPGDDDDLEDEKRRLNNVEKLSTLSEEAYQNLYENEESTITTLERVMRRIDDLAGFDAKFGEYREGLQSSYAVLEDLAFTVRDFRGGLEFSPERLEEIENRLAEISRIKRKYGGTVESALAHFEDAAAKLETIENAEFLESQLIKRLSVDQQEYAAAAQTLHELRLKAKAKLEKQIEANLKDVSMEKARFEVRIEGNSEDTATYTARGFDSVEFYFSANVGEAPKPIAKVASGGELSRLMLVLNTVAKQAGAAKTMVFDEIDTGIGGRVAEAVGVKLKNLSATQQVLCVTHQPQVASLADHHFLIEKASLKDRTKVAVRELSAEERVEEIARMLAGETITETARQHAREMIAAAS
jgi:DNA repair protein RecN (Recombination protein N)